jgi:hypothetical protein
MARGESRVAGAHPESNLDIIKPDLRSFLFVPPSTRLSLL